MAEALHNILKVSQGIKETAVSHLASIRDYPVTPNVSIDLPILDLPQPISLVSQLLDIGLTHEPAIQISTSFFNVATELRLEYQRGFSNLCAEYTAIPSTDPLARLERIRSAFESLYEKKTAIWVEEVMKTTKDKVAARSRAIAKVDTEKPSFNHYYVPFLEHYFAENPLPTHADKEFLATKCGMTFRQIHVWFQNRRNRTRKEGQVFKRKPQHELGKLPLDTLIAKMPHSIIPEDQRVPYVDPDASEYECLSESSEDSDSDCKEKSADPKPIDVLDIPGPAYVYPAMYPPGPDAEPYPEDRWEVKFSTPQWERRPAKASAKQAPAVDFVEFTSLFAQMNTNSRKRWRKKLPQNPRKPTKAKKTPKSDRSAATIAITTIPLSAPLPALIRTKPAPCRFLAPTLSTPCPPASRKRSRASVEAESSSSTDASQPDVTKQPSCPTQRPTIPASSSRKRRRVSPDVESSSTPATPLSQPDVARQSPPAAPTSVSRKRSRASVDAESSSTTATAPSQPDITEQSSSADPAGTSRKRRRVSPDAESTSTTPAQREVAKQPQPSAPSKKTSTRKTQKKAAPLPKRVPKNPSVAHHSTTPTPPLAAVPALDHSLSPLPLSRTPSTEPGPSKLIRLPSDSSTASEVETPEPCRLPLPPNVQPPVLSMGGFDFGSSSINDLFDETLLAPYPSQVEGLQLDFSSSAPYYGGEETIKLNSDFDFERVFASHPLSCR